MFPFLIEFESKGRSTTRFDRNALRLSVWHFDFFCFTVFETDHAGIFAFRAEEGKVLQYRVRTQLCACFAAALGAA